MDDGEKSGEHQERSNGRGPVRIVNWKKQIWRAGRCLDEGCERDPVARNLCGKHYQKWQREGREMPPITRKPREKNHRDRIMCEVPGCVKEAKAHRLCEGHYGRSLRYGLGFEDLAAVDASVCEGCGCAEGLHVDHCHTEDRVRGVLCGNCNKALGLVKDNMRVLIRLAAYLERSTR